MSGWSIRGSDIGFDERGAAVLHDWLQIVHAQLPDWIYPTSTGGGVYNVKAGRMNA